MRFATNSSLSTNVISVTLNQVDFELSSESIREALNYGNQPHFSMIAEEMVKKTAPRDGHGSSREFLNTVISNRCFIDKSLINVVLTSFQMKWSSEMLDPSETRDRGFF